MQGAHGGLDFGLCGRRRDLGHLRILGHEGDEGDQIGLAACREECARLRVDFQPQRHAALQPDDLFVRAWLVLRENRPEAAKCLMVSGHRRVQLVERGGPEC